MSDAPEVVRVARDLREIEELHGRLMVQAINDAGATVDGMSLPGGEAMVALANVASPDEWSENVAAAEFTHYAMCPRHDHTRCSFAEQVADEDDAEPPLQTLLFWSEQWRTEAGYTLDHPTMRTEANFIRSNLAWAWDNLLEFADFAKDIATARSRLENLLKAGNRPAYRGVPCMYDECKGARLIRVTVPARGDDGLKTWRLTDWHCPKCKRSWTEDEYARNVYAASESVHYRNMGDEAWCTVDRAATRVGRPPATVWSWVNRCQIVSVCTLVDQRTFVLVADVHDRHRLACERSEHRKQVLAAKRTTPV